MDLVTKQEITLDAERNDGQTASGGMHGVVCPHSSSYETGNWSTISAAARISFDVSCVTPMDVDTAMTKISAVTVVERNFQDRDS